MSETGDPALIGRRVAGKFLVEKFLGGGAMGAVYRAKDSTLDRSVALKVMHPAVAVDPAFVKRFHREARAASRIEHPNAMRVIEFGEEPDGLLYIAMEFLEGRDLYKVIHEDWPIPEPRIADIMMKALAAMQIAHDMGVIHRDLKPENIMILNRKDDEGQDIVKVCDFGIAKITENDDGPSRASTGAKLTTSGLVVGTPEYMSPEQARGETLDARSDVYSMGIILYQLLTGRTPFLAETALAVVLKHITETPEAPSVHYPGVHKGLEQVCIRGIAKAKEDRFQSAREMRLAIRAAIDGRPVPIEVHGATTPDLMPSTARLTPAMPAGAPAMSQPMKGASGTSRITPLGTAMETDGRAPSRMPLFMGVALVAIAAGAAGFVFVVRPAMMKATTTTPTASTGSSAVPTPMKSGEPMTSSAPSASPIVPEPSAVHSHSTHVNTPPPAKSVKASSGGSTAPASEPLVTPAPEPAPAPAPAPAPPPAPAPAPPPAPVPAPAPVAFNASSCKAVVGAKKSTSSYNAKDLTLKDADATWTNCARTQIREKPAGPIAATVHMKFSDNKAFRGASCAGCAPAGLSTCVTSQVGHIASVNFRGGDATGDPEFDVPVTFSCD